MQRVFAVWLCLALGVACRANIITVDDDGSADYTTIQAAIDASNNGDVVVVCPGTYTGEGNYDINFGGRAITIRSTDPQDPAVVAATIIDCEHQGRGFYFGSSEGANSVLDGLTITNAGYYDLYDVYDGGGIYCSGSSPTVANCRILNSIGYFGGGICNDYGSSPTLVNCVFGNNLGTYGGGMCNYESEPNVINCTFIGNTADDQGGGMYSHQSNPIVNNCTFSGNVAYSDGGGILNNGWSDTMVSNCILWGNAPDEIYVGTGTATVNYSDVQGGYPGIGNIEVDPMFVEPGYWDDSGTPSDPYDDFWVDGNYHLLPVSPCIDTGDPNYVPEADETDLDGNPRIIGSVIDMGAYEFFSTNTRPVADTGEDRTVFACVSEMAEVKLDGAGSYDADGDELEYFWFEQDEQIATGVDPNVLLGVGEHIIEIIVGDGTESSDPNEVVITVVGPVEADVHIVPRTINRQNRMKRVMAIIRLPEGIGKHDIADEPFVLEPGGVEAIWDRVIGRGNQATVFALFDKNELMNALTDTGRVESTVIGKLKSGQCIYGTDTVRIVRPRRRGRGLRRR